MTWAIKDTRFNPNPITKLLVVGLLGMTVLHTIDVRFEWAVMGVISLMYFLNGMYSDGVKNLVVFAFLVFVPGFDAVARLPFLLKMMVSLVFLVRMFYIPFAAGRFLVRTADVGSILSSMDYLRVPSAVSIPVAVMFRFFPSFSEERKNIKMAMKVRGLTMSNPIMYLQYVSVPLLIISSYIADDIAKAAETRGIANPIGKTRYFKVGLHVIDFIYAFSIAGLVAGGWICLM